MGVAFYTMFVAINWLGLPLMIAIAMAFVVTAAVGLGVERVAFSTLRARNPESIASSRRPPRRWASTCCSSSACW